MKRDVCIKNSFVGSTIRPFSHSSTIRCNNRSVARCMLTFKPTNVCACRGSAYRILSLGWKRFRGRKDMEQEKSATLTNLFGGVEKDYNAYMFCGWLLFNLEERLDCRW